MTNYVKAKTRARSSLGVPIWQAVVNLLGLSSFSTSSLSDMTSLHLACGSTCWIIAWLGLEIHRRDTAIRVLCELVGEDIRILLLIIFAVALEVAYWITRSCASFVIVRLALRTAARHIIQRVLKTFAIELLHLRSFTNVTFFGSSRKS